MSDESEEPRIITSIEEFEALFGPITEAETERLAHYGMLNFLKYGQGGDEIGGVLGITRVPSEDDPAG